MSRIVRLSIFPILIAALITAWTGQIQDADLRSVTARQNLSKQIYDLVGNQDSWVVWSFERVPQNHRSDRDYNCEFTLGEKSNSSISNNDDPRLRVILQMSRGKVVDVDLVSESCPIRENGHKLYQISGVADSSSIELLSELIAEGHAEKVRHGALTALALHFNPEVDQILAGLVDRNQNQRLTEQAIFWLGEARGATGFQYLEQYAESTDKHIRHHVTFGLFVSRQPQANELLFAMARDDESEEVQGQAIFWLAQKDATGIIALIEEVLATSRSDEMIEKSLLALSQIPQHKGFPLLKELAVHSEIGKIRARALFWLAQDGGDDALPLIEAVLNGNPLDEEYENALMLLSMVKEEKGVPLLSTTARNHKNPQIRGKALFWLGQTASQKIKKTLEDAVNEDPDQKVREEAVFGISQQPREVAIPQLIKLVREHHNQGVRQQAIFWLTQLGGEEAIDVINEVLAQ